MDVLKIPPPASLKAFQDWVYTTNSGLRLLDIYDKQQTTAGYMCFAFSILNIASTKTYVLNLFVKYEDYESSDYVHPNVHINTIPSWSTSSFSGLK